MTFHLRSIGGSGTARLRLPSIAALLIAVLISASMLANGSPSQRPFVFASDDKGAQDAQTMQEGVGHFSQWSKAIKREFVDDVMAGKANEWTIVMGNEGGDLDSMTAALTWSYHISHKALTNSTSVLNTKDSHENPDWDKSPTPAAKAIALLQTPKDALDLRPENRLALHNVQMSPGHRDLLTFDELPLPAEELAEKVRGIILVDHPEPLVPWRKAKVLSIFDHHKDRRAALDADPRIFEGTASCTTIVARQMLDELQSLEKEYHMPHEVVELILDAIALDSSGLKQATPEDVFTSRRLLKRSNWRGDKLINVMQRLDDELKAAQKNLDNLDVRDLLRRDWKGSLIETRSERVPNVQVGFASIPLSLDEQIKRTLHERVQSWFQIEQKWASDIGADVSLSLHKYKVKKGQKGDVLDDDEDDERVDIFKKRKIREICLVVRTSDRLDEQAADSLFATLSSAIGDSPYLDAEPWYKADQLQKRQMVWVHHQPNGGRKLIRPIIEHAVRTWREESNKAIKSFAI